MKRKKPKVEIIEVPPDPMAHVLATIEEMHVHDGPARVTQCRWVCACNTIGIYVGDLATADGRVFLTADDRARAAHGWHARLVGEIAEGGS